MTVMRGGQNTSIRPEVVINMMLFCFGRIFTTLSYEFFIFHYLKGKTMSVQTKTIDVYKVRYDNFLKRLPDFLKEHGFVAASLDADQKKIVATSVIQLFSLTPESFQSKSAEICDCLVKHKIATQSEADLLKTVMRSYAEQDTGLAKQTLDEIAALKPGSRFMETLKRHVERELTADDAPDESGETSTQRKKGGRNIWEVIGGIVGAVIGGIAGAGGGIATTIAGAALGYTIGKELGGALHDSITPSGVVAMPDGRGCTPPLF